MRKTQLAALVAVLHLACFDLSPAQQTVGLFQYGSGTMDGYTLFAPMPSTTTYLIDNCGREVHSWPSGYTPAGTVRLLADGNLLRTCRVANAAFPAGGLGGRIQFQDWDGTVNWFYQHSSTTYTQHHDATVLPNGNVLFISWENKTRAEAIAAGRDSVNLLQRFWPDAIIEVQPMQPSGGTVVWEWHAWDHLVQEHDSSKANWGVVADHPELIDVNYYKAGASTNRDWMHTNAVAYNATFDQIALSIHNFDEIWVIDHSTTTQEAAGHTGGNSGKGGDLLYRYGNPQTYHRGTANDQVFWGMHDVDWVPAGDQYAGQLMVFNNGLGRPLSNYSTVDIWQPPVDGQGNYTLQTGQAYGPGVLSWQYEATPNTDFYSSLISSAMRLPGNHTIVCEGNSGRIFELDENKNLLWEYVNPVQASGPVTQGAPASNNSCFRAYKYAPSYPGFTGHSLVAGDRIEGNPLGLPSLCTGTGIELGDGQDLAVYPNPFQTGFIVKTGEAGKAYLLDAQGRRVMSWELAAGENRLEVHEIPAGIYLLHHATTGECIRLVRE